MRENDCLFPPVPFSLCLPSSLHSCPLLLQTNRCLPSFTALLFLLFSKLLYLFISLFARCTDDHFWKMESIWCLWLANRSNTSLSVSFSLFSLYISGVALSDRTWRPLWEQFLDQGERGPIWKQWALCQTHLDFLLPDKEWVCLICFVFTTVVIMLFPSNKQCFSLPCSFPLSPLCPTPYLFQSSCSASISH